jgi:hypothetical protein
VLVGKATGGLEYVSFTNDLLTVSRSGETEQSYKSGGNIDIYLQFSVRATTMEERDNLVDITGIYLSHPDAKNFFMRHDLKVPEAPKLNSESEIHETGIDYPIYATDMTMRFVSRWEEYAPIQYRLSELLVDFDLEAQVTVDTGRTVLDTD